MRPRSEPLSRSRWALMSSGMDHGCSPTSRYMSNTCSVPSGAVTKFTGRNQLSVEATNSHFSSIRRAVKVAPRGSSARHEPVRRQKAAVPIVERVAKLGSAGDRLQAAAGRIEAEVAAAVGNGHDVRLIGGADVAAIARRDAVNVVVHAPLQSVHERL